MFISYTENFQKKYTLHTHISHIVKRSGKIFGRHPARPQYTRAHHRISSHIIYALHMHIDRGPPHRHGRKII